MRKLALCSSAFAASVFITDLLLMPAFSNKFILVYLALAFLLMGSLTCLLFRKRFLVAGIAAVFFGAGIFCYWTNYVLTTVQAERLTGKQVVFTAETLAYPEETEYGNRVRAELKFQKDSEFRSCDGLQCIIYSDDESVMDLKPGEYITLKGYFRSAEQKYGEDYDVYRSNGVYLLCTAKTTPELTAWPGESLSERIERDANSTIQKLSWQLKTHIQELFQGESAAFFQALMTGDKSDLYEFEDLYYAMGHAGFTHIVAVSGMHVAYLVAVLQLLLGKKRSASVLSICLVWLFVLVTGCSPSATRAAIMQTMLLMAAVLRRENDSITSLSFALAVILLKNPYAAASVSLQLSFAAVAGICLFSDKISSIVSFERAKNPAIKILNYFLGIAATTLSVMVFTVPLTVVHFGYIPLYSILTNLFCLWTVPVCFCGGYLVCFVSFILPSIGAAGATILSFLAETVIFRMVEWVSALPYAVLYFSNTLSVIWLICVYILFLAFAVMHVRTVLKILIPLGISAVLMAGMVGLTVYTYTYRSPVITVLDVGQGECITAFSGNRTVMIDCGSIFTQNNAGEVAGQFLNSAQRNTVDLLVLSHLDEDHMNGVSELCRYVTVKRIVMPYDVNTDDAENLKTIEDCAAKIGIEPEIVLWGSQESENELSIYSELYYSSDNSNEDCFFVKLSWQDFDMLISGDNPEENELQYVEDHDLSDIDVLVVGHHGSKYSSCDNYLQAINGNRAEKPAIISVGYNTYGHPTEEALERLKDWGFDVYRTDECGNVTVRLNSDGTYSVG